MKKIFLLALAAVLLCLPGCTNQQQPGFFGTYTFEKVSYLSPLSSASIDYLNQKMAGTIYTITADRFKIESPDYPVEIHSPNYRKEDVSATSLYDARTLDGEKIECQYTIYEKDKKKTRIRLYTSSSGVWICKFTDHTANGTEIIMEVDKLSKR